MSLVEWCERQSDPYEKTNSISNIAFLLVYAVAPVRYGAMRRCDQLIALIGLGSFYFHISGSYVGELLDELPMSLLAYFYYVAMFRYSRIYALTIASVWILYVIFELYSIFVVFFALQIILPVFTVYNKKRLINKTYLMRAAVYMAIAASCWGYERYLYANGLCPINMAYPIFYLHSYWHFGTAVAHYNLMLALD
jgi:hypothetical protein